MGSLAVFAKDDDDDDEAYMVETLYWDELNLNANASKFFGEAAAAAAFWIWRVKL